MRSNCGKEVAIEDLGHHSAEAVRGLRSCLAAQPNLVRDPKRKNLFEVQGCSRVYYIHVSPVSGKVSAAGYLAQRAGGRRFASSCLRNPRNRLHRTLETRAASAALKFRSSTICFFTL